MKKIVTIIVVLFGLNTNAQTWFVVPDAAFVNYLHNNMPNTMQGDSLNTSSALVTGAQTLNLSDLGIANLNGIQYFTSLTTLNCSGNTFTTIPALPNTITYLDCSYNAHLKSLPALPTSLQTLWCQNDSLLSLPALPNSLQTIFCFSNYLTALPTLPTSLQTLECYFNALTTMPALPASLTYLQCFSNALTTMPVLNNSLTYLDCHSNNITTLNSLGTSISSLYCGMNNLSALPALPASLTTLDCDNNSITSLPTLPTGLTFLDCSYNQLTELPALPALSQLYCENNSISCFPPLPNTIELSFFNSCLHDITYYINISNNPNTCVPNIVGAMGADSLTYQVCKAGNANGCAVTGINQLKAINDAISVYPNPASTNVQIGFTDNSGEVTKITIYDVTGKMVSTPTLSSISNNTTMDVSGLPEGVYTISIISNLSPTAINKKLVIVK